VEDGDRYQVRAVSRQIQHAESAEAKSDGRHRVAPDSCQIREDVDDANEPAPHGIPIRDQLRHRGAAGVGARERGGAPEQVDGDGSVAQRGEP
jgi:hypothetical protein